MRYRLLNRISFNDFESSIAIKEMRISVKGIIRNDLNQILMVSLESELGKIVKLPGGGVKIYETYNSALIREIKEETGFSIRNITQFGCSVDFVEEWNMGILTIFMVADFVNHQGRKSQNLTELEKKQNLKYGWLDIENAISKIKNNPNNFYCKLINKRDLKALIEYAGS